MRSDSAVLTVLLAELALSPWPTQHECFRRLSTVVRRATRQMHAEVFGITADDRLACRPLDQVEELARAQQ